MSATCVPPARLFERARSSRRNSAGIYAVEQGLASIILLGLAPGLLCVALLIRAMSRRSPLIAHLRVGQDGRPLWVLKFRTMWDGAAESASPAFIERIADSGCPVKTPSDPRVTSRFAAFCRAHSIDELPQLWHVARGEMSFVGPRPITASEIARYYGRHATEVLSARPGLTGLWQTMGRNRLTYSQRLRLDLFLVRRRSMRLYLRTILRTIPSLLSGADAW